MVQASVALHGLALAVLAVTPGWWPWLLEAVAANHLLLGAAGLWPRSRLIGANLVRLPPASARAAEVALTFDDGPHPQVTPAVLDLLDNFGAKASFFCVGQLVTTHPDLVRDILRRGHSVENHTQHHPKGFSCYGPGALRREITAAQAAIEAVGGHPRWFRAPMGLRSPLLDPVLARLGLRYASWTRRGYDAVDGDAAAVLTRLTSGLGAGSVLLLHDGCYARTPSGQPVVLAVLPELLKHLAGLGLHAVSLPMALPTPRPARMPDVSAPVFE